MSCCGNKRKEWLDRTRSYARRNDAEYVSHYKTVDHHPGRLFEYTGNYSLTVYGSVTGRPYHFKFKGDKLKVDHTDAAGLMAERELKISKMANDDLP